MHALAAAEGLALHDVWEVATRLPTGVPLARWVEVLRSERRSLLARTLFGGCALNQHAQQCIRSAGVVNNHKHENN